MTIREGVAVRKLGRETVGDLRDGHLRLLVVGGDVPWRRYENAGLARPLLLAPAVEEVRDVGVLLGLGGMQLTEPVLGEHLGDRALDDLPFEDHRTVEVVPVPGHGREVDSTFQQPLGQLSRPVGTEVEVDRHIVRLEPWPRENDRLHELIGHTVRVRGFDGGDRVVRRFSLACRDRRQRAVGPIPALIAVHGVVATRDRGDLRTLGDELGQVRSGRGRRDVAAVGEGVDVGAFSHSLPAGQLEQRPQVVDVGMNAAVRSEPEQVDVAPAVTRAGEGVEKRRVLEEPA